MPSHRSRRREAPTSRRNASGKRVWRARWTDRGGTRRYAGTFALRGPCKHPVEGTWHGETWDGCCAQHAIDAAYEREAGPRHQPADTVGAFLPIWLKRYPRAARTNATNEHRITRVLNAPIDAVALRDWPLRDLRRKHANELVHFMLTVQGRAVTGAQNILRALSAMAEDAIDYEIAEVNPFKGVKVRANDPRVQKQTRPARVLEFDRSRRLASVAATTALWLPATDNRDAKDAPEGLRKWRGIYAEAMIRTMSDAGLRLGEAIGLQRTDLAADEHDRPVLSLRGTAHNGVFIPGDQPTKKHVRAVPVGPSLEALLRALPARLDTRLLFPTPTGRMWWERNFYRDVWAPARRESGIDATPQDLRHSWVTQLRAAGVDPADLAKVTGHSVETATARYTHALDRSHDRIREVIG